MSKSRGERILIGIDPGTIVMGYGLLSVRGQHAEMLTMGVIELSRYEDHYTRLGRIYKRVAGLIDEFLPDEMALEAPFYGKNVQSMLKLGRAQGVAMAAALSRDIPIAEYVPMRVKQAITGTGQASKEQVATMLQRVLRIPAELMPEKLDATDGLAVAYCHFLQTSQARSYPFALTSSEISKRLSTARWIVRRRWRPVSRLRSSLPRASSSPYQTYTFATRGS